MTTKRIGRHWFLLAGGVLISGLLVALAADSLGQTKGKDKKDAKTDKKSKEAKVEPPPAKFPARVDTIDPAQGGVAHVTLIDDQIKDGWQKNNTYPSERCTDYEFIRRASLDILGRIPTVGEIKTFMGKEEKSRRSWLINEMLDGSSYDNGAEFATNFANLWTVLLLTRTGSAPHAQNQMRDWLYTHFKGESVGQPGDWSKAAKELIAGAGVSNKSASTNYLLHNMGEEFKQDTSKNGRWDMVPATSRTTRLFLGIRTQCVQCHDHPFNGEWKQENFWGINAFFRQLDTPRGRPQMMMAKKKPGVKIEIDYDLEDNPKLNEKGMVLFERRNNVALATNATFLDGKKVPKDWKGTRREALAKFVIESPFFAKAFVNRSWNHFMGKSFTKDNVDDFGDGNPASHPELLDKLAEDWSKNYKHDPKVLVRWICNSQAYGLSSKANKWNDQTDHEPLFARMLLKPMTPEQMFMSMVYATTPQDSRFKERLEKRLSADSGVAVKDLKVKGKDGGKKDAMRAWLDKLVVNFGNDEGEEGNYSGTVVQALMLMNGVDVNNAISEKDGAVDAISKKHSGPSFQKLGPVVREMYLQVLSREPSQKELKDFMSPTYFNFRPGSKTQPTTPAFWTNYYQDVMWALLNSNEFVLNH